jgi:hypothetical protein
MKLLTATILLAYAIPVLAWAVPPEIKQAMKTTENYKHEAVVGFQTPPDFHKRRAGNCVDFAMHWQDVLAAKGIDDERMEIRVDDNPDGTTHMTLVIDGLWQMSAEPKGQFVREVKKVYQYDKGQRYVMVTDKGARIPKANQAICERDAKAASRLHNVRCEKAGM